MADEITPPEDAVERLAAIPAAGPGQPRWPDDADVTTAETHVAVVHFVGDRAYKVKKAVDLGFLDFSTVQAREHACRREVQLNRRLAPDTYLGMAPLVDSDDRIVDHAVVMRRLPASRRMSRLLDEGRDVDDCLREVARRVAALHVDPATALDADAAERVGSPEAVRANWHDNLATLRDFPGVLHADEVDEVAGLADRYLDGRQPLFRRRIEAGLVRDGHGDLLTQDIFCLDDGPRIMDCLEFDTRYRHGDVLLDVAFLAMDLERLGHPAAAGRFLDWYLEFSGEHHPASLAHHYRAYRAQVRAKVACLRHAQGEPDAAREAVLLHRLALQHLRAGRVRLVLVGGLPGTGKSTVAAGLASGEDLALLRSDEVRKELAGLGHDEPATAAVGRDLYRPAHTRRVYDELLRRARGLLELGVSVVLDATWTSADRRDDAARVADDTAADLVQIRCHVPEDVARSRLLARPPGSDASDATPAVLAAMAEAADPWPQAAELDTRADPAEVVARARQLLSGEGGA